MYKHFMVDCNQFTQDKMQLLGVMFLVFGHKDHCQVALKLAFAMKKCGNKMWGGSFRLFAKSGFGANMPELPPATYSRGKRVH